MNREDSLRRGRVLEYLTLAWNMVEAVVAVGSGVLAGSTALVGFGVDSIIESSSGAVLLWRLQDDEGGEAREEIALRLVGVSFLLLAAWVLSLVEQSARKNISTAAVTVMTNTSHNQQHQTGPSQSPSGVRGVPPSPTWSGRLS